MIHTYSNIYDSYQYTRLTIPRTYYLLYNKVVFFLNSQFQKYSFQYFYLDTSNIHFLVYNILSIHLEKEKNNSYQTSEKMTLHSKQNCYHITTQFQATLKPPHSRHKNPLHTHATYNTCNLAGPSLYTRTCVTCRLSASACCTRIPRRSLSLSLSLVLATMRSLPLSQRERSTSGAGLLPAVAPR